MTINIFQRIEREGNEVIMSFYDHVKIQMNSGHSFAKESFVPREQEDVVGWDGFEIARWKISLLLVPCDHSLIWKKSLELGILSPSNI